MLPDLDSEPEPIPSPNPLPKIAFPLLVESFYASLIRHAPSAETGLGGWLLYVGELDEDGRALMVAANIAGAASLADSVDPIAQRRAIHDGTADFLVTNLDEALRVLKNEIRKHEPVAVCVAAAPASIEQEMLERGVLPDLVREPGAVGTPNRAVMFGGNPTVVAPLAPAQDESLITWSVDEAPAKWLPRLDAIAMECFASDKSPAANKASRWLRLAPRYLGRLASKVRVVRCPTPTAHNLARRIREGVHSSEIALPVRIDFV